MVHATHSLLLLSRRRKRLDDVITTLVATKMSSRSSINVERSTSPPGVEPILEGEVVYELFPAARAEFNGGLI